MLSLKLGETIDVWPSDDIDAGLCVRINGNAPMALDLDEAKELMVTLGYAITLKEQEQAELPGTTIVLSDPPRSLVETL